MSVCDIIRPDVRVKRPWLSADARAPEKECWAATLGGVILDEFDSRAIVLIPRMWVDGDSYNLLDMAEDEFVQHLGEDTLVERYWSQSVKELMRSLGAEFWFALKDQIASLFKAGLPYRNAEVKFSVSGELMVVLPIRDWIEAGCPDGFDMLADWIGEVRPQLGHEVWSALRRKKLLWLSPEERRRIDDAADAWLQGIEDDLMRNIRERIIYALDFEAAMPENLRPLYRKIIDSR